MKVNPQQLRDDGYLIIRECIPSKQLDELRHSFEVLVERQKGIWVRDRKPDDPTGGVWETSAQPRLWFDTVVDKATANTVEFCLHENTLGVSRQLMCASDAAVVALFLMCSPVRDHGPSNWHRDIHPIDQAPLTGLQMDLLENAPGLMQWNIPLYNDNVLWVVPGSHRRPNTKAEDRQLLKNPKQPLPNSIPVELKEGDGVVYANIILHWGSNYSTKLRRTIHLGYRAFGGLIYPYVPHFYWDLDFTKHLSPLVRSTFERFEMLFYQECRHIVSVFNAIINKDADDFRVGLAALHPGENRRIVCVILLSKLAYKMRFEPTDYGGDLKKYKEISQHFSSKELETLWGRFVPLDAKLQSDTKEYVPGFQSGPMKYYFNEMPTDFDVEDFIASWDT